MSAVVRRPRQYRLGHVKAAVVASLALHALGAWWFARLPGAARRSTRRQGWVELSVDMAIAPQAVAPPPRAELEPELPARKAPLAVIRPISPTDAEVVKADGTEEIAVASPPSVTTAEVVEARPTADPAARRRLSALLDPSRMTMTALAGGAEGWPSTAGVTRRGSSNGASSGGYGAGEELAFEKRLDAHLHQRANATPHLSDAVRPKLTRRADGSFVFRGHMVGAVIFADGSVDFGGSGGAVGLQGMGKLGKLGLSGALPFDLTDAVMRAQGADPAGSEKRWFLRHTEALRRDLQEKHNAAVQLQAALRLQGRLMALWNDAQLSAAQRHKKIFEIWDQCDDKTGGRAARQAIEAFVRRFMPYDSAEAYSNLELRFLNAHRKSANPFSPYAATSFATADAPSSG